MKPEYQIIDQILALKAQLAGKRLELAMARGNRSAARDHLRAMNRATVARRQLRIASETAQGACYFAAAGEADRVLEVAAHG
jgi:hypothetical protein